MVRVSVEVGGDVGRFRVLVEAESIERAMSLASERYPDIEARLLFPIDPSAFFAGGCHRAAESILLEVPEEVAG